MILCTIKISVCSQFDWLPTLFPVLKKYLILLPIKKKVILLCSIMGDCSLDNFLLGCTPRGMCQDLMMGKIMAKS